MITLLALLWRCGRPFIDVLQACDDISNSQQIQLDDELYLAVTAADNPL